jgi:aspartate aminotransferase
MKFSKRLESCELSPIRKFYPFEVDCEKRGIHVYHLNIGQPDIRTPQAFFDAIHTFKEPVVAYAPSPGLPALTEAIARYYEKLGIHYEPSDILITSGGSEALHIVLSAILDEGDELLVPEPYYSNYKTFARMAGAEPVPIPTLPENGYRITSREEVESRITPNTRAMLFTNPNNPTGVVLSTEELRMLADIAKEHDLFLVADEVYREFVYEGEMPTSVGSFDDLSENAIIIDSVSKRFSACGARVGCIITRNKKLQEQLAKLSQARLSVATIDQVGATALYNIQGDYFAESRDEYRRRRDTIYEGLKNIPGVVCSKPQGAFYVMAKLPVDNVERFQTWLLTEFQDHGETVMFAPGDGFYSTPGMGMQEVRMAYVLNTKDLQRATELLALALEQYPGTIR